MSTAICLWSGPRNVSTALLYAFGQRADTRCTDEPLYAHYLRVSGADHPGRDEVLAAQDSDGERVVGQVVLAPVDRAIHFQKHMAHHLVDLDLGFLEKTRNVLLIRDPAEVVVTLARQVPRPSMRDVGIERQFELLEFLEARGQSVPVVAARALLLDPEGVLRALCRRLEIPWDPAMLSWPAGPRPYDGVWARHWYENVHRSTGFGPYVSKTEPTPDALRPLIEQCRPFYERLLARAIRAPSLPDPRNADILVWIDGVLLPRSEAKVSVFDSVVQGGDAVWEGIRVYDGRVFALDEHLARLTASARALAFAEVPSEATVRNAIFATLRANGMRDGAHMRVTLTRGRKVTSGMDPRNNQEGCTLIVLAEWKAKADTRGQPVDPARGITLITSATRRNHADCLDSRIHHNNLLNNILAKIEANAAGADDALMLDCEGFLAETNATNVFLVRGGVVVTPIADRCLPGITRAKVLDICAANGIALEERRVTLDEAWTADEMFVTGTLGELTPVATLDGRPIGGTHASPRGPVTARLQRLYADLTAPEGSGPEPELV